MIALNLGNLDSTTAAECLNEKGIAVRAGFHCAALAHRKMHTDRDGVVRDESGRLQHPRAGGCLLCSGAGYFIVKFVRLCEKGKMFAGNFVGAVGLLHKIC